METTKIFIAAWVDNFFTERGIIGYPEPDDFSPEVFRWLDEEALDQLHVALTALRADRKAQKGHALANKLITAIDNELGKNTVTRLARSQVFRQPNHKAGRKYFQVA